MLFLHSVNVAVDFDLQKSISELAWCLKLIIAKFTSISLHASNQKSNKIMFGLNDLKQ